ncbi:hypothetical protein LMH73_025090 [Vibrio splendidus]|nr:hypothetical protein [Vibrio splendidus]MCC4880858.1 hypothetical protein [Vibrio splendidus]
MRKNFLLVALFDNDFGGSMHDAAEFAMHNLDCTKASIHSIRVTVINHMIGTQVHKQAASSKGIDWDSLKNTAQYLERKIEVSVVDKLPGGYCYDGGAAYADLNTGDVFIL